ncbi:MAG: ATP-binding protein, partial [Armatimonadota bacterium]|nr:ATP-binding protein [Armatimonadota bacterium]
MPIRLDEWTDLLRREYLEDFIASGGSAVKIVVTEPHAVAVALGAVENEATSTGYLAARVDSAATRIHMIHQVFHAVARQVDWDRVTNQWMRSQFSENGITVPEGVSLHEMDAIADANDRLKPQLFGEINRLIQNGIEKDYAMAREFRTAVTMLCLGIVNPQNVSPSDADVVKQWLRGEFANLSSLKRLQIYQKIGRHNARLLLSSLAVWLRKAGYSGLVLTLDINAVTGSPAVENSVRYTRAGVLDTYEVLRQCI